MDASGSEFIGNSNGVYGLCLDFLKKAKKFFFKKELGWIYSLMIEGLKAESHNNLNYSISTFGLCNFLFNSLSVCRLSFH